MKVKKNKLKLLENPEWKFVRNPDDCKFGTFRIIYAGNHDYLCGIEKGEDYGKLILVAKKKH
jgi:hypothetical protein